MLKLSGSLLIVTASIGFAYCIKRDLAEHLRLLYQIRKFLVALSCEAAYSMQPVEILLGCFVKPEDERLRKICGVIAERLTEKKSGAGERIWREVFEENKRELRLTADEMEIVEDAGTAFFGKSMDENRKHLSLVLERLDFVIENTRREQKEKQKVYQTVSVMFGFMLIILLL